MHDQMTIGMFQCSVSMRVSFVLRSAEETLETSMHSNSPEHRNGSTTQHPTCMGGLFGPHCMQDAPHGLRKSLVSTPHCMQDSLISALPCMQGPLETTPHC